MENYNDRIKNYFDEDKKFMQIILKKSEISKANKYEDEHFKNLFKSKNLLQAFIFFSYIKENFSGCSLEENIIENKNYNLILNLASNAMKDFNYNLLFYWHHYLLISFINELQILLTEKKKTNVNNYSFSSLNKILSLFKQNNHIIYILYKNKKIIIEQIVSFLNIYIFWLRDGYNLLVRNEIEIEYDLFFKLKNYYIYQTYFELIKNIFVLELKSNDENNNLKHIFDNLNKLIENRQEININKIVLLNNDSFNNFFSTIINNMNKDIYKKYSKNFIKFFKSVIYNNFELSKTFEKMIENMKNSFLNLSAIKDENNKEFERDIIVQNFYFELLNELFDDNSDILQFFNFNGIDSAMSFNLKNFNLSNTIAIFSFKFYYKENIDNEKKVYPLFTFHNKSEKKDVMKLYIEFKKSKNKFYLYLMEKKKKIVLLEDINIEKNKIYYIALYFQEEKMSVFLNNKNEEKKINSKHEYNIIQIGYDEKHKNYFSGEIGPFFLLEISQSDYNTTIKFIKHVLNLNDNYPNFIYTINKGTIYDFGYLNKFNFYSKTDREQKDYKIYNQLEDLKTKFNFVCTLCISPFILKCYGDIEEQSFDKYFLPAIPYICEGEKYYNIDKLNISLLQFEKIELNFLMNNGLYYISLQYEYFFQLLSIILDDKINIKFDAEINDMINKILNNSLTIISKYSNNILNFYKEFKMMFLNLLNCMKKLCLLNRKHFSDSFIKKFGDLMCLIFNNIEYKRQNNDMIDIKESDINKLIVFRDSLIDFLFTTEFYKNSDVNMIEYISTILISINKCVSDNIYRTNSNLIWKIVSFIQLLENKICENKIILNDDENDNRINAYENRLKNQIFSMLKDYFLYIKSESYHREKFSQLFYYCLKRYKDNYIMMYHYLNFIHDLVKQEYYLEKYKIKELIKYARELLEINKELKEDDNNIDNIINIKNEIENEIEQDQNKENRNNVAFIILLIVIDLFHIITSEKQMKIDLINLISSMDITFEKIKIIIKELDKVVTFFFKVNNSEETNIDFNLYINEAHIKNFPKIFSNIFSFTFSLIKIINEGYFNIKKDHYGMNNSLLKNEVLSFIYELSKKFLEEFEKEETKENIYFIFENYIKFLNKIVSRKVFDNFSPIESSLFIMNLSEIVQICIKQYILNTNILIKIKIEEKYYQKTFIEIIIDIFMIILLNEKFFKSHKLIYDCLNRIIFDPKITQKGFTIFYFNDIIYSQKKPGILEKNIYRVNDIFHKKNKEKFKMSFSTFALFKFVACYIYQDHDMIRNNNDLKIYLENIINKLLKEHLELFKLNKDIFFKESKNIFYKRLKEQIENYIILKNKLKTGNENQNMLSDFKDFFNCNFYNFNSIFEEITSGDCNIEINKTIPKIKNRSNSFAGPLEKDFNGKNLERRRVNFSMAITESTNGITIPNDNDDQINEINILDINNEDIQIPNEYQNNLDVNLNEEDKFESKDIEEFVIKDYINEEPDINISELTKNTYYLEYIDDYYIFNIKKDVMNNIFSIYFIDTFYSNDLFKKMKLYFLNEHPDADSKTKILNYPSKIKKFNNGLEPDNILKLNYKFFYDKYFPVSHPYFYQYMIKNKISPSKYIKLFHKNIDLPEKQINCELIKMDKNYFGQLFCFFQEEKTNKFLIFQEKKKDFKEYDGSIFDSEENGEDIFSLSFLQTKLKKGKSKAKYKNQIKRKKKIVVIHFNEIEEIIEKRFYLMWQAIEIYLKNGKSYFFNLLTESNKTWLLDEFEKDKKLKKLIHKKDFFIKKIHLNKGWKKGFISTYENLLLLNKYGSRSFNDSSQYPVFPWILLKNYDKIEELNQINNIEEENLNENQKELLESSLRKFKYPICMQNQTRREDIIYKYTQEEDEAFQHHLGIHYSTSSYIYYYLMRQQPFGNLMIKLQNYQEENPNRMFLSIADSIFTLQSTKDSREIIPELFSFFEYLLNLNCDFYGIKHDNIIVDDNNIISNKPLVYKNNKNHFFQYAHFIIEHKKLLNSKIISKSINDWIDNIFGIGQYPNSEKQREICCNIFIASSYEQHINLKEIYLEKIEESKNNYTKEKKNSLLKNFLVQLNLVMNFGQVPYQIFKEKYYKLDFHEPKNEINKNDNFEEDLEEHDGFEFQMNKIHSMNKTYKMKEKNYYNYFEINPSLNKIFILSEERFMEVINTNLYSIPSTQEQDLYNNFTPLIFIQLPHFLLQERKQNQFGSSDFIYNMKYAFSSFGSENNESNKKNNNKIPTFKTYGRILIENLKKNKEKQGANENDTYFKFITCRYADKSFKIHQLPMDKSAKNKGNLKIISFVCEDFVSSCCTVSFCQFLIGLRNGKLIQCSFNKNIKIKIERYIKCHKGRINSIEINKKFGLIITCGDDNYILIRKLYDFELLSPIKIKDKYIITLAKVSPLNFLYVLCYNKQKNSKVIFGYTLNGLKFAKSDYGNYENFDFTENGNIVTLKKLEKLCILHGSNLASIIMDNNSNELEIINKIKNAIWLKYDYFLKKEKNEDYTYSKIISYINDKKSLITLDVSDNSFFN